MKHFVAVAANGMVVGVNSVPDDQGNPYTQEMLDAMTPPGVRTFETTGPRPNPRKHRVDVGDIIVDDLVTPELDRAGTEDESFDKVKDALRAVVMAMNDRLETAGLPKITAAEVKANFKQLRGHP